MLAPKQVVEAAGHIDILINNAGVIIASPIVETDNAAARRLFDVNYWGLLSMCQVGLALLLLHHPCTQPAWCPACMRLDISRACMHACGVPTPRAMRALYSPMPCVCPGRRQGCYPWAMHSCMLLHMACVCGATRALR